MRSTTGWANLVSWGSFKSAKWEEYASQALPPFSDVRHNQFVPAPTTPQRFFAPTMTNSTSTSLMNVHSPPRSRRRGRIAKLPKMNNSERGKYYRNKNKQHEVELEHSVVKLRKQVCDLELFLRVRDELYHRNPYDACETIACAIYDYFVRARDGHMQYELSFQPGPSAGSSIQRPALNEANPSSGYSTESSSMSSPFVPAARTFRREDRADTPTTAFLFFDLVSFHVEGCVDAPVVAMRGMLHTKYTRPIIDRMFPHLLHYQDLLDELLDKEVQYPCTYRFYFGSGGKFENKIVEADYVHGLQQAVGNLEDVIWLLDGARKYTERRDSMDDMIRGPAATMSLEFILS